MNEKEAGYIIGENGKPIATGVICKCDDPDSIFCPMHGYKVTLDYIRAHRHCSNHKEELEASEFCGCCYCLETFKPNEIKEWIDVGHTALCPKCDIDSVIGSASGYPVTKAFLKQMQDHWFGEAIKQI